MFIFRPTVAYGVKITSDVRSVSPPVKYFYWPFQGSTDFMGHLCYLCFVFVMLLYLFIVALWSPAGKGLTSWLSFVMFNCVLSLSHVVSWVRCGT